MVNVNDFYILVCLDFLRAFGAVKAEGKIRIKMKRILIFGNSGSGKSTLARHLADKDSLEHLDLDTIAWLPEIPPQRMLLSDSRIKINDFLSQNKDWVVEGCYSDLLELLKNKATEIIFLNLSIEQCIANAKNRPWEPHKYQTKEEQEGNLSMLIDWVAKYKERRDTFSFSAHQDFYDSFEGKKVMYTENIKY